MRVRRRRFGAWTFAVVVAAWLVVEALSASQVGLLYVAPALLLAMPLLMGRYVGEEGSRRSQDADRRDPAGVVRVWRRRRPSCVRCSAAADSSPARLRSVRRLSRRW